MCLNTRKKKRKIFLASYYNSPDVFFVYVSISHFTIHDYLESLSSNFL